MRRRASFYFNKIANSRSLSWIQTTFQEMPVRLRAKQGLTIMQFVTGAMLRDDASESPSVARQGITTPADTAQAFYQFGIVHARVCLRGERIMPCHTRARG